MPARQTRGENYPTIIYCRLFRAIQVCTAVIVSKVCKQAPSALGLGLAPSGRYTKPESLGQKLEKRVHLLYEKMATAIHDIQ